MVMLGIFRLQWDFSANNVCQLIPGLYILITSFKSTWNAPGHFMLTKPAGVLKEEFLHFEIE